MFELEDNAKAYEENTDSEEEGSDEEETEPTTRKLYNNQELMKVRLQQLKSSLEWLQHLDVTTDMSDITVPGVNKEESTTQMEDDFKREMMFYCQAQVAAKEALSKLRELNVSTERPEDYFAEMVKSDVHMQKVRQKLLNRKESMEKSEKAKKQRQLKKFGKKIQHEVLQKRQQEKKKMLEAVDRIKKNKNKLDKLNDNGDDLFQVNTQDDNKKKPKSGHKRKFKEEKFGFGGKKRKLKKNSAESSAEGMNSYKRGVHGNKTASGQGKFKKSSGTLKGKPKRLGKSRRSKAKRK